MISIRNPVAIIILGMISLLLIGCSASEKRYEENMNLAYEQLELDELDKAEQFFKKALEERTEDEKATIYLKQTTELRVATEQFITGKIVEAKEHVENVISAENGLDLLIKKADVLREKMIDIEGNLEVYMSDYEKAEQLLADKDFEAAIKVLDEISERDLTHPFYETFKTDVEQFKTEILKAEEEEKARIKAEEERIAKEKAEKEELERLARKKAEKEEQEKLAREKEEHKKQEQASQGIGLFKGYWLRDTMACHFAETYVTCALANSDFITYSEIIEANLKTETEIELTFEGDIKNTLYLLDENTLQLSDGTYKRVSEEEANAIYDGYYTLP